MSDPRNPALRERIDFLKSRARNTAGVTRSEITIDVGDGSYRIFYQGGGWRVFKQEANAIVGVRIAFTNTKPQALAFVAEQLDVDEFAGPGV